MAPTVKAIELVEPASMPRVLAGDVDDDQVIAAAVAARADLIVSGGANLPDLKSSMGIEIVTAAVAVERIAAGT